VLSSTGPSCSSSLLEKDQDQVPDTSCTWCTSGASS
jgi:hypothetical protein